MTPEKSDSPAEDTQRPGPHELREQPFAHWENHPYGLIAAFGLFFLLVPSVGYATWLLSGIYVGGGERGVVAGYVLVASRVLLSLGLGLLAGSRAASVAIELGDRYTGHSK